MSEERYNPGFLTDDEYRREQRRTREMVESLRTFRDPNLEANDKSKGQGADLDVISRLKGYLQEQKREIAYGKQELEGFEARVREVEESYALIECPHAQYFEEGEDVVIKCGESIIKGSISEVIGSSLYLKLKGQLKPNDEVEISDEEPTLPYDLQLNLIDDIEGGKISRYEAPIKFFTEEKPFHEISREVKLQDVKSVDGKFYLNDSQIEAVEKALSLKDSEFLLIIGPPGTGKTVVIKKIAYEFMKRGEKVLIASHTNIAIDNAIDGLPQDSALRVGVPRKMLNEKYLLNHRARESIRQQYNELKRKEEKLRDQRRKLLQSADNKPLFRDEIIKEIKEINRKISEIEKEKRDLLSEEQRRLIRETPIIGTTLIKSQLEPLKDVKFDMVIIDECSQASITLALLAMVKGKKWILVGDHKQLLPIFRNVDDDYVLEEFSVFNHLKRKYNNRAIWLTEFYRSNKQIIEFVKTCVYFGEKELKIDNECENQKLELKTRSDLPANVLDPERPIVLIQVEGEERKEGDSRYNDEEIKVCIELVSMVEKSGIKPEDVGIITPYRAQRNRLIDLRKRGIEVGTVDSFQGREKDIIIFSIAATEDPLGSRALSSVNKLNVALTRARKKLIVLANFKKFWNLSAEALRKEHKPRGLTDEEEDKAKKLLLMLLVYAEEKKGLYYWSEKRWLKR